MPRHTDADKQTDRQADKPVGDVARDAASFAAYSAAVVYTAQAVLRTDRLILPQSLPDNKGRLELVASRANRETQVKA